MTDRFGPKLTVIRDVRCTGCAHLRSEYYCIEDGNDCDSGVNYSCAHFEPPKRTHDEDARTPEWCPFLGDGQ